MTERAEFSFRYYQPADLQAIADLYQATDRVTGDIHWSNAEMLERQLAGDSFDAAHDTMVVEQAGQIVAFSSCDFSAQTGEGWAECVVHPDHWKRGIGTELMLRTEARVRQCGEDCLSPARPISLIRAAASTYPGAIHLFETAGYEQMGSSYRMRIELDAPVEALTPPQGLSIRAFELQDAQAAYEAHQEAFADHVDHEHITYEDWQRQVLNRPGQDNSLWLVACEGAEIVGLCVNRAYGEEDPQAAWIGVLAVRRHWRKRGLGMALLKGCFALFQASGYRRALLGVDAANPTHAVALYERAGMQIYKTNRVYRKLLRAAKSDN